MLGTPGAFHKTVMTTHFNLKLALAAANRRILATAAGLLALLLPILYFAPTTRLAALVFALEAGLCLALFLIKNSRRAAIWGNWEATTQSALLRHAFHAELNTEPLEAEASEVIFLKAA
jgi:hypothetical protein